jgi:hypothetical protein
VKVGGWRPTSAAMMCSPVPPSGGRRVHSPGPFLRLFVRLVSPLRHFQREGGEKASPQRSKCERMCEFRCTGRSRSSSSARRSACARRRGSCGARWASIRSGRDAIARGSEDPYAGLGNRPETKQESSGGAYGLPSPTILGVRMHRVNPGGITAILRPLEETALESP